MIQSSGSRRQTSAIELVISLVTKTCAVLTLAWAAGASPSPAPGLAKAAGVAELDDRQIEKMVSNRFHDLGSLSVGKPNNGRLLNPVRPEDGTLLELVAPDYAWATQETVHYLTRAVKKVHTEHPDTPPLHVGHISKPGGGYLSPHRSHQSGRDIDLGFYYKDKRAWYRRATWKTLDVERTWTLVKALITETDVDVILVDHYIQLMLKKHARAIGEDEQWLHEIFVGDADRPRIIRHAHGHSTHLHVRFFNPIAQTNAQRAYPFLVEKDLVEPVTVYAHHRAQKGDTLGRLARRYGTSVRAIQAANGLRNTLIQARKVYKIPRPGGPTPVNQPLEFPPRRLP